MNVEPKIWNSNTNGTQIHVFLNGQAKCGSADKQNVSPMHTRSDGMVFVEDTPGLSFCQTCETSFLSAERKVAARKARTAIKMGAPVSQDITETAYRTLQAMSLTPETADYDATSRTWSFTVTPEQFKSIVIALNSDRARKIGLSLAAGC